jgi:hypothetical protein
MPSRALNFSEIAGAPYEFVDTPGGSLFTRHPEPKFKIGEVAKMTGNRQGIYVKASADIPGPTNDPFVLNNEIAVVPDTGVASAGAGYLNYAGWLVGECGWVVGKAAKLIT